MSIRKHNQEKLKFWAEFAEDAMKSLTESGFTRAEAVRLIGAMLSAEMQWIAVPPGFEEMRPGMH